MNKTRHLRQIKPLQAATLTRADQLEPLVQDKYVVPDLQKNDLLSEVKNNISQLDSLISQVCILSEEIHSILKK